MPDLVLMLKGSTAQQQAAAQLVSEQQDPASPNYHRWVTPEEYADRFGVSQNDVTQVVQWLQAQGFTGVRVARSRMWISFRGDAQQVTAAFGTPIDQYSVGGAVHYANTADPTIPADFAPVIAGIRGLHNFRLKPRYHRVNNPQMTSSNGSHHIVPDDFAVIYNVAPLYTAKVDGTGQKLVVVGQSDIAVSDITNFRSKFNLPAIDLQRILVQGSPNPGVVSGDQEESDLDIEWSSAVARNASILFVYSDDVWKSAMYAVDQNLAPVLSMSYGGCESYDLVDLPTFQASSPAGERARDHVVCGIGRCGRHGLRRSECDDRPEWVRGGCAGIHSGGDGNGRHGIQRGGQLVLERHEQREQRVGPVLYPGAGMERYGAGRRSLGGRRRLQHLLPATVVADGPRSAE